MNELPSSEVMYGYAPRDDGEGGVLIIGVTDEALKILAERRTWTVDPGTVFPNVKNVIVFAEPTKDDVRRRFNEAKSLSGFMALGTKH
jgi:hypothetical protein